jgi:hypothetical protein
MEELKKGDKVRVRLEYRPERYPLPQIGQVASIDARCQYPVLVAFDAHIGIFKPHELEKVSHSALAPQSKEMKNDPKEGNS